MKNFTVEDMLQKIDRDAIKAVIKHYTGVVVNDRVFEQEMRRWAISKLHIFGLFGGKLKLEKDVDVQLPSPEIDKMVNPIIKEYLEQKELFFAGAALRALSSSELGAGHIQEQALLVLNKEFPRQTRVAKILGDVVPNEFKHKVETDYSMLRQSFITRGKAVCSIDPIDYLTMSCNSSGWQSCHRINGGEFASGTISYMVDNSTVISYLASSKDTVLNDGTSFANKTWRQIVLISPKLDFAIQERHYPAHNSLAQLSIGKMLAKELSAANGEEFITSIEENEILQNLHLDYAREHGVGAKYYNDIRHEMLDEGGVVCRESEVDILIKTYREAGSEVLPMKAEKPICLSCGDRLDRTGSIFCSCCTSYDYDYDDYYDYDEY